LRLRSNIKGHFNRTIIFWWLFLKFHLKYLIALIWSLQLFLIIGETWNIIWDLFLFSIIRYFSRKAYYGVFIYGSRWIWSYFVKYYGLWFLKNFLFLLIIGIYWTVTFVLIYLNVRRNLRVIYQFLISLSYSWSEYFQTDIMVVIINVGIIITL